MTCIHVHYIARLMSGLWVGDKRIRKWVLPRRSVDGDCSEGVQVLACGHFQKKYDTVQKMIQQIGCMDELLSGECSFDVFEHPRHHHFEWSLNGIHHQNILFQWRKSICTPCLCISAQSGVHVQSIKIVRYEIICES